MVKTCRECAELKEVEVEAKIGTDEDTRDSRLGRRHLRCGPADLLDPEADLVRRARSAD